MSISSEACRKRLPDGNTLLTTACTQGREQIVQILLPHVNALETNQDGLTALHCAALAGQLEIVQLLIQENINPNHPTADNQHTAFTLACQEGHLDVVAYFIEEISDILWKNQFGKSAIDYAIDSGSCEVISFLLQQPIAASLGYFEMIRYAISIGKFEVVAHILQSIRETFETPDLPYNPDYSMEFNYCVHAIMISNMELLDCLLQIPSVMEELKVYVAEGNDLLVIPAKENNLSLISYLVEKHQINRLQKYSCGNAFKVACKRGFLEIVQYFAEKCSPAPIYNVDTVFMACKRGHIPVIKYLLESQQFDPTMIDSEHLTLLYYAAQQANLEMVKYLFPFFFPSKTDSWYNIFLWAIQEGHLDLIKSILDRFTSESHSWWSSSTESSPLIQAVTRNQIHVVRYFIEECPSYKNRFSAKDLLKDLNSAMYMAGFRCLIDMSKYLLSVQRGSQTPITILDLFDWSIESGCLPLLKYLIDNDLIKLEGLFEGNFFLPLQHATRTGYLPLVKFFLLKLSELNYAQPDFEDREGTSLMHTACEYGELELVQFYLEEIGMYSPLQPNNRGQIPLIIAIEKAHQDKYFQVAKFLIEILGLEAIEIVDALSCAGTLGNIDLVRMLCPSVTTDEDLVFWAARKGYVQLVKNLVELRGWEAHVLLLINSEDESLLICATKSCKLSVIHYLLETLNCPTDRPVGTNKHTALDWAVKLGHVEAVKLLIEHKALVKPSHVLSACRAGHVPVVRYLLDVCKFTLDDFTGVSPFFKACIGGHIVMVAFLLDRRFVRMDSEELQSALVLACRSGNLDLVKLFLDENWSSPVLASKTFVDTPILPAAEKGFLHIVDYLIVNWKVPITLELIKRSAPTVLRYLFEQALQYLESVEFIIEDREAFLKWEEAMKLIKIPPAFTCFDSRSLLRRLHKIARNAASEWTLRKVLVVGHEGAGKTTLCNQLRTAMIKRNSLSSMMFGKFIDIRTNGIDIHTDVTLSRVSKSNLSSPPVRVNLWDLGGQPEFHPTHLFFMPGTQIFLVIFDISDQSAGTLSTTQSTRIMYWLNCISTNCQDYSMITTVLVASHKDKCPPADRKVILQKLAARYLPHYPHLYKEILSVCGISGSGFNKLERLLYMIVSDTKYTQTVQHSWVVFYEKICSLQMTHAVISLDTFKEEMRNCEVPDEDKHDLIQFLQSVGAILYFQDSRGLLSSTVILRPSWVSSAMASLVSFKTRIHADSGFVSKSALQAALGSNDEVLLKLLQRFGIVVQHRKSEKFVVPLLLETNLEPLKFPSEKTGDVYFTRSYVSEFNSGFFSCLLVHILQLKFQPLILKRYAVLLQYHAHQQALINMIHGTIGNPSTLEIRVRGPAALGANHRCELLRELHDVVMNTINFHSPQSVHRKLAVFVEYEVSKQVYKWPTDFVVSKLNSGFIQLGNGQISLENIAPDIALSDCVRIDYSDLRIIEKLGQGGGGCAYLAAYREAYVVVKTVDAEVVTHDYSSWEEFLSEISMHSAFDHPNITRMLGYTIKQNSLGLVMEFMEGTDLYHQIKELNEKSQEEIEMIFPIIKRIQIAIDIVNGMKYLHSRDPCVIHRDLRSPNVLLSHSLSKPASHRLTAKITDFGLSRKFYYSPMVGCQRTWQWMAPEIIESYYDSSYKYTNQVDIYSFGIVLWELLTLQFPFGEYEKNPIYFNSETNNFDVRKIIRDIQQNHLRPSIPEEFEENPLTKPLCDLIRQCWHPIPNNRPKFLKVLLLLTQIYHKYPSVRSADPPVGPDEIFTTCDQKFTSREVKKRFKHEKLSTVGTFAISDILNIDNTGTLPSIRTVLVFVQDNKPYRVLVGCETGELLMYPTREYVCVSDSEVCYLGQLSSELFYYATLNGRICIQNINTPHVSIQAWQGHVDNHISCVCPLTCNDRLLFCVGSPEQGGLYIWDVHAQSLAHVCYVGLSIISCTASFQGNMLIFFTGENLMIVDASWNGLREERVLGCFPKSCRGNIQVFEEGFCFADTAGTFEVWRIERQFSGAIRVLSLFRISLWQGLKLSPIYNRTIYMANREGILFRFSLAENKLSTTVLQLQTNNSHLVGIWRYRNSLWLVTTTTLYQHLVTEKPL